MDSLDSKDLSKGDTCKVDTLILSIGPMFLFLTFLNRNWMVTNPNVSGDRSQKDKNIIRSIQPLVYGGVWKNLDGPS